MSALADGPVQYELTAEQRDPREMIRALVAGKVAPRAAARAF